MQASLSASVSSMHFSTGPDCQIDEFRVSAAGAVSGALEAGRLGNPVRFAVGLCVGVLLGEGPLSVL